MRKRFYPMLLAGWLFIGIVLTGCRDLSVFNRGTTVPNPVGSSFLVLGDNRSGNSTYRKIVKSMTSLFPFAACVINTGDMIRHAGNRKEWGNFMKMTVPLAETMPWYAAIGNHDVNSLASQQIYQEIMDLPGNELYYSFDALNSHFIVLDTEIPGEGGGIVGEQLTWLKQDLQTHAPTAQFLFVVIHHPLYPQGRYQGHNLTNADELHQLFMDAGVDVVFAGHEHQYYVYRKDTIPYVVTGGGGALIYKGGIGEQYHHFLLVELLPPDTIVIHVLDVRGKEIRTDSITSHTPDSPSQPID